MTKKPETSKDELRLKELQDGIELYKAFGNYNSPHNIRLGTMLHDLAQQYGKLGDYNKSKESFEKALGIFEKWGVQADVDVSIICSNLADTYYYLREFEKSTEHYERALTIFEKQSGNSDSSFHISEIRRKLERNHFLGKSPTRWGSDQHFYTTKQTTDDLPQTCASPSDTHHKYLELPPRFYSL